MTVDLITQQRHLIDAASGPVLAYCRSGTRCTHVWALGQAGDMPADRIIATAAAAGYDVSGLAPYLHQKIAPA
jgi:uncharacterized protein (TIGR01244 family)